MGGNGDPEYDMMEGIVSSQEEWVSPAVARTIRDQAAGAGFFLGIVVGLIGGFMAGHFLA